MGAQEKIKQAAKEKNIKLEEHEAKIKIKFMNKTEEEKIKVFLPDEKNAEDLFKAAYSAKAARGLLLSKLKTNQQDEIRAARQAELDKKISGAPAEVQDQIMKLLNLA